MSGFKPKAITANKQMSKMEKDELEYAGGNSDDDEEDISESEEEEEEDESSEEETSEAEEWPLV